MVNAQTGELGHVGVAMTFGFVILVMILANGHISGAHFNPSVTVAFALTRHFPWRDVLPYVVGQLSGALAGGLTVRLLIGNVADLGTTRIQSGVDMWQAFGIEVLLTASLMYVIISVATDTKAVGQLAAIAIGLTVAVDALWGGPLTGASMNPARSLGPAIVAGVYDNQWLYVIAPTIGAAMGALAYEFVRESKVEKRLA
jgi:MIP family channel proteins